MNRYNPSSSWQPDRVIRSTFSMAACCVQLCSNALSTSIYRCFYSLYIPTTLYHFLDTLLDGIPATVSLSLSIKRAICCCTGSLSVTTSSQTLGLFSVLCTVHVSSPLDCPVVKTTIITANMVSLLLCGTSSLLTTSDARRLAIGTRRPRLRFGVC